MFCIHLHPDYLLQGNFRNSKNDILDEYFMNNHFVDDCFLQGKEQTLVCFFELE